MRLYIVLSCVPAVLLFVVCLACLRYYPEDSVYLGIALVYLVGGIFSFFALYHLLMWITVVIIWIVEGFK